GANRLDAANRRVASAPTKGKISRPPALAKRFRLVSGARPIAEGLLPVGGGIRLPLECSMVPRMQERPVDVIVDVGGKPEEGAAFHDACQPVEIGRRNESSLPVPALWPGIGIQQVDTRDRSR